MISRPAMNPVLLVLQPQVRLPADSNNAPHEMQVRTLILMGERFARRRAWFFNSMSLTTEGGKRFTLFEEYSFIDSKLIVHLFRGSSLRLQYPTTYTKAARLRLLKVSRANGSQRLAKLFKSSGTL